MDGWMDERQISGPRGGVDIENNSANWECA